ncbi:MAG: hypothetical protein BEN19_08645 [Epulopiscium sp. Nuni2H_MBin003]|nr:MAG: hypothetical protein BEN19_08645 [Epulopiscium sp. Nuni2H_MBin003]
MKERSDLYLKHGKLDLNQLVYAEEIQDSSQPTIQIDVQKKPQNTRQTQKNDNGMPYIDNKIISVFEDMSEYLGSSIPQVSTQEQHLKQHIEQHIKKHRKQKSEFISPFGKVLLKDVYNNTGKILFRKGEQITEEILIEATEKECLVQLLLKTYDY